MLQLSIQCTLRLPTYTSYICPMYSLHPVSFLFLYFNCRQLTDILLCFNAIFTAPTIHISWFTHINIIIFLFYFPTFLFQRLLSYEYNIQATSLKLDSFMFFTKCKTQENHYTRIMSEYLSNDFRMYVEVLSMN